MNEETRSKTNLTIQNAINRFRELTHHSGIVRVLTTVDQIEKNDIVWIRVPVPAGFHDWQKYHAAFNEVEKTFRVQSRGGYRFWFYLVDV